MIKSIVKGIVILLAASTATALMYNYLSSTGIPLLGQWDAGKGSVHARPQSQAESALFEISDSRIVEKMIANQSRIIIDVRHHDQYTMGHLPGALNFPLSDFQKNFPQMMKTLSLNDPLLIYCSSVECTDSHTFADILKHMKFTDVKIFSKGFRGWKEDKQRIETGEN